MDTIPSHTWSREQDETFDHLIDILTGIFRNEKAARIRLLGYREALRAFEPVLVLGTLRRLLHEADTMPTPHQIRQQILQA